ncbi:hypothetical protein [Alteromonas lipotrueiana]|uniref:hypothetical protein n=1 Tax=Alteromonas lipotrueiana TaxID=2803815 RepID=UPI001C45CDBD|nr:hypothetical protein [Alteromonas lipotrueiana]|tara:strand:- start:199 stop:567 length:369 start_codon:yes stop_codon:yes gene_type:complete
MKKNIGWLVTILLSVFLIACSTHSTVVKACSIEVSDSRFSNLMFEGPYTIKQATDIYNNRAKVTLSDEAESDWQLLFKKASASGCIYKFTSSESDWDNLRGVEGLALVRDDKVTDIVLIKKN